MPLAVPEPEQEPAPEPELEPEPEQEPAPSRLPEAAAENAPSQPRPVVNPAGPLRPGRERVTPSDAPNARLGRAGIELRVMAGARVGDGQSCMSLGALGLVQSASWVLGVHGRANGYMRQALDESSDSQSTVELGVLGGHRSDLGKLTLDVLAGPALALDAGSANTDGPAEPNTPSEEPRAVPRLVVASHLGLSPRSVLRGYVGVEGEVGPRTTREAAPPQLPGWMVGIALGAAVGTR
jgi:hypothetical protein